MNELDGEPELHRALEAILFSSNRPLKLRELQHATDADRTAVERGLDALRDALGDRALMIQRQGDQVLLVTRPELAPFVRRALRPEVTGRLSPAAYETLAIVAYQQPVTRSRVEEIRGVNSDSVISNLEMRDLVMEVGRVDGPGQARLYGTTMRFLQVMGLESLEQLPAPPGIEPPEPAPAEASRPADAEPHAAPAEAAAPEDSSSNGAST